MNDAVVQGLFLTSFVTARDASLEAICTVG